MPQWLPCCRLRHLSRLWEPSCVRMAADGLELEHRAVIERKRLSTAQTSVGVLLSRLRGFVASASSRVPRDTPFPT
jgi:hypothetical protein